MRARLMFWTGINPHEIPVRDVLSFNDHVEDIIEEYQEMLKNAVAAGVAEVLEEAF